MNAEQTKSSDIKHNNFISKRAEIVQDWADFLVKYLVVCNQDEYNEKMNPKGYVNLGTGVNNLCTDIILPKLTSNEVWSCNPDMLLYQEGYGIYRLRKALAELMTNFFNTPTPLQLEDLFCTVGVTSAIDLIAHCLADPGEVILVPTPVYGRIKTDLVQRSGLTFYPIPIIAEDNEDAFPSLTLEKIVEAYKKAKSEKYTVRGVFIVNPSNPLGDVYGPELLMKILNFCKDHELHAVVDEVYGLSVFSGQFHSVLKFPTLPDANRTHVLYGLSKDFGVSGLRVGVIHTRCKILQNCLSELTFFTGIPYTVMDTVARFLEDLDWCEMYVLKNRQRLVDQYNHCALRLGNMGLKVRKSEAGFFLWVDFRELWKIDSFEKEMQLFNFFLNEARLYIVPGKELFSHQPGWFRITFSTHPQHVTEGLNRLEKAIQEYKNGRPYA